MAQTFTQMSFEQLSADVAFLLARANRASSFSTVEEGRDTGLSSNSIVRIAYGAEEPSKQELPSDKSDLAACERMWEKLPAHRKTDAAKAAMEKARKAL